jgi:pyrroline-5-carboxylate reductase
VTVGFDGPDLNRLGRVLMVGCGNMGGAILRRWLAAGLDPERVTVVSPSGRAMPAGVKVVTEVPLDARGFDTVVLAFKPQQLDAIARGPLAACSPKLLVSILAGVRVARLTDRFPAGAIVRAMPNLPVAIGKGVVALHGTAGEAAAVAEALMAPLGLVEWIDDEALFDVVTALSGSGPGFTYRFIDALAAAGAALGLPADQAARFATATVEGSALLAAASADSPAMLADRVASPGGSTREGLNVLDRDCALVRLLTDTLAAATQRNRDMADAGRGGAVAGG